MVVQKLRLKKGWSQQQLADFSGLSVRTVQRIEAGQPASTETLKSLAAVFEVDFTSLEQETPMTTASPTDIPFTATQSADRNAEREEQEAFSHVRQLRRFYGNLAKYVAIIPLLWLINWYASPHVIWAIWPTLGWGLGVVLHGLRVFRPGNFLGPQWERREVEKRLGRPL